MWSIIPEKIIGLLNHDLNVKSGKMGRVFTSAEWGGKSSGAPGAPPVGEERVSPGLGIYFIV